MNVTKKNNTTAPGASSVKRNSLNELSPIEKQLLHFLTRVESARETRNTLFKMLDLSFQSDDIFYMDKSERANMFYISRELIDLVDCIYRNKNFIFKDLKPTR